MSTQGSIIVPALNEAGTPNDAGTAEPAECDRRPPVAEASWGGCTNVIKKVDTMSTLTATQFCQSWKPQWRSCARTGGPESSGPSLWIGLATRSRTARSPIPGSRNPVPLKL